MIKTKNNKIFTFLLNNHHDEFNNEKKQTFFVGLKKKFLLNKNIFIKMNKIRIGTCVLFVLLFSFVSFLLVCGYMMIF